MSAERGTRNAEQVLVCFAMKEEAGAFRKIAAGRTNVSILVTGIGRRNTEKAVRERLAGTLAPPELVFTCGFAGGLDPALKSGDVVFECGTRNAERGTKSEPSDIGCYNIETRLVAAGAKQVKFFCADRIATTVAEKKKLREQTGADAVEMESAVVHEICRQHNIPCVTVRVISDTANEDLPLDFNQLAKADQSLDFGKLAWAIAKSPGKIPALMALGKKTNVASKRLAAVLERLI